MSLTLFLCGDVMIGRGVDQILRHPSRPEICEPHVTDARQYVELAEAVNGPIPRSVAPSYIWGDALDELGRVKPDARIVNLETAITVSAELCPKGINYRMHPANVECLTVARLDACVLANNHVLDYGVPGLVETLETLERARIGYCGAGRTLVEARKPAVVDAGGARVIVLAFGSESSGVPPGWAASPSRPGVDFLPDLSDDTAQAIGRRIAAIERPGDVVVASIHWGGNWGYAVSAAQVRFARQLIDVGADIVHGHSSHHPRPIEVYRGKLILYGCGDLINDYEGILGYEQFRDDLALMYFPSIDPESGRLVELRMTPMQIYRLRLRRASVGDAEWMRTVLDRISAPRGARVVLDRSRLRLVALGSRACMACQPNGRTAMSLQSYIKRVACLSPRASVVEACQEMKSKGIGTIVVVSDDYKPLGLVTDRDIATRVVAERKSPDTALEEVMTRDVVSLPQDASIQQASEAMRDKGVRRIPITDENGRVTGIISFDDLLLLLGMEIGNLASAVFKELSREPEAATTAR